MFGIKKSRYRLINGLYVVLPILVPVLIQVLILQMSWIDNSDLSFANDYQLVVPKRTVETVLAQPVPKETELEEMFAQFANEYGIDRRTLEYIAYCESRWNPKAVNGKHAGMYQFNPTTWSATRVRMGQDPDPNLRFDARESIRTAAHKISEGGIGAWAYCSSRLATKS